MVVATAVISFQAVWAEYFNRTWSCDTLSTMTGQTKVHDASSALATGQLLSEQMAGKTSEKGYSGEKTILVLIAGLFTIACLAAIWLVRFLPMQDYPQHLLQAHIVSMAGQTDLDFRSHFDARLHLSPYVTFYAVTSLLAQIAPIEVAGKLAVSIYVLAVAGLVLTLILRPGNGKTSWGVLLFFPFMFNQAYFLGMMNSLYSLPLLVLAVLDQEAIHKRSAGWWPWCRQIVWLAGLFFTHPFTYLAYVGLAIAGAAVSAHRPIEWARGLAAPVFATCFFGVWMLNAQGGPAAGLGPFKWLDWSENLAFYGYMFTGMRWSEGIDKAWALVWLLMGIVVGRGLWVTRGQWSTRLNLYLLYFALATLVVFVLPFRVNVSGENWHHVNLRVAPLAYFLLATLVSQIRFTGLSRVALVLLVAVAMGQSFLKQQRIASEIGQIAPIIDQMVPNAAVLPLVFDNETPQLDRVFFDVHLHGHCYYHLLAGGGVNPYFFSHPLMPVRYRPGALRPAPPVYRPERFNWPEHAADYRYLLIRQPAATSDAYAGFLSHLAARTRQVKTSGRWLLLETR